MTEDQQATEDYFRALGWEWREWEGEIDFLDTKIAGTLCGYFKDGKRVAEKLPDICQSYPGFKKWVIEEMGRRDPNCQLRVGVIFVWWESDNEFSSAVKPKDNEILRAAVVAATRYLEEKK